jgi:hypothetical protein
MRWTRVSDLDDFVCYSVLSIRSAGIHSVNMIDAAANSVLLDDSNAHCAGEAEVREWNEASEQCGGKTDRSCRKVGCEGHKNDEVSRIGRY